MDTVSRKKISQVEAWSLRHRVKSLEKELRDQKNRWRSDWSNNWVTVDSFILSDEQFARVDTARRLQHAVVLVPDGPGNKVRLYADRL